MSRWVARARYRTAHLAERILPMDSEIQLFLEGESLEQELRKIDPRVYHVTDVRPMVPEPPDLAELARGPLAELFKPDDEQGYTYPGVRDAQ